MQSGFQPGVDPKVVKESNVVLRLRYWVPYIDHLWPHPNGEVVPGVVVAVVGVRPRARAAALPSSIVVTISPILLHNVFVLPCV